MIKSKTIDGGLHRQSLVPWITRFQNELKTSQNTCSHERTWGHEVDADKRRH